MDFLGFVSNFGTKIKILKGPPATNLSIVIPHHFTSPKISEGGSVYNDSSDKRSVNFAQVSL